MRIVCYGNTDTGLVREHNEDAFFVSDTEPLYVVADGMGGHNCGEVAARIAVETIAAYYAETSGPDAVELVTRTARPWPFGRRRRSATFEEVRLETSIHEANRKILEAAQKDVTRHGMGTTLVAAFFTKLGALIGHVGDSRCYRLRDGRLEQLTVDHSLANEYVRMKILAPEDVENFPYKNVIVRALGLAENVQVEVNRHEVLPGDTFLLCSDGLSDMVPDRRIRQVLLDSPDLETACEELIEEARRAGGADNITAVLARLEGEERRSDPTSADGTVGPTEGSGVDGGARGSGRHGGWMGSAEDGGDGPSGGDAAGED